MSIPAFFPGAWYGDALPNGARVIQVPGQPLQTHAGVIELPPGEHYGLMFPILRDDGGAFAGLMHDLGGTYEWIGDQWIKRPFVTGHVGYVNGEVFDMEPAGVGYVAGNTPVSRLITYETKNGLNSWSEVGGIQIGQGHERAGVKVWNGVRLLVLDEGPCNEIRVHYDSDRRLFSVTYRKDGEGVYCWTLTPEALLALPPELSTPQPPPVDNPPVDPPKPPEPPKPMPTAPNKLAVVQSVIAAHPEINRLSDGPFAPNRGGITQLVAQQLGYPWGRKSKDQSATNLSDDALCYRLADGRFEIYDILNGTDGGATWEYKGTFSDGENGWFKQVSSAPPDSGHGSSGSVGSALDAAFVGLSKQIAALDSKLTTLTSRIAAVEGHQSQGPASLTGTRIALKTESGKYVCAENGGGGEVNATRDGVGGWETFTVEQQ